MKQITLVCLGTLLLAGCFATGRPASWQAFSSFSSRALPDRPGLVLMFRPTDTSSALLLRSVRLRECENVRGGCDIDLPADGRVEPLQAVDVLTVFPIDPSKPMSFKAWVMAKEVKGGVVRYESGRIETGATR